MVHKHQFTYSEGSGTPEAIPPGQLTFTYVFEVIGQIGQILFVFQPIPYKALVLKKGGFAKPSRTPPMEQFVGAETRRGTPLGVHG